MMLKDVVVVPGRFKLSLEYPLHPDVDLAYVYSDAKSNRYMGKINSESLRKKLQRDKKQETFHNKVW